MIGFNLELMLIVKFNTMQSIWLVVRAVKSSLKRFIMKNLLFFTLTIKYVIYMISWE